MVRLVPMNETEFQAYVAEAIADYGQEHAKAGRWRPEDALKLAEEEYRQILPNGLVTPDQHFFTIEDETNGDKVGMLWFAVQKRSAGPVAFVYDVKIYEQFRRHGYGTQAFQALEDRVRELGLSTISLHVFGHNTAARAMYEKLGYVTTNVMMSKKL